MIQPEQWTGFLVFDQYDMVERHFTDVHKLAEHIRSDHDAYKTYITTQDEVDKVRSDFWLLVYDQLMSDSVFTVGSLLEPKSAEYTYQYARQLVPYLKLHSEYLHLLWVDANNVSVRAKQWLQCYNMIEPYLYNGE